MSGAKLTMEKAEQIRKIFREDGPPLKILAETFGVTVPTIRDILHGVSWKNGEEPVVDQLPNHAMKLSDDDVRNIRYMHANGISPRDLAIAYDINPRYVWCIVTRESRGYVE